MFTVTLEHAEKRLFDLMQKLQKESGSITIIGKNGINATLVSEKDWKRSQKSADYQEPLKETAQNFEEEFDEEWQC